MQELVKSVSIDNMLNQRNAAIAMIQQAQSLLIKAQELTHAAHLGSLDFKFVSYNSRNETKIQDISAIETVKKSMDSVGWSYLMKESGLRSFMDCTARSEFDEEVRNKVLPELTRENIEATFETLYGARGDMFERGVINIFRGLSWNYKTNSPSKFGNKIIITYLFDGYGYVNHRTCDQLDDLMRVFHVLDSKPEPDHRSGMYSQLTGARREIKTFENDYVHVKWYKKGTGHITFKRMEMITTLNKILAKHYPDAIAERQ